MDAIDFFHGWLEKIWRKVDFLPMLKYLDRCVASADAREGGNTFRGLIEDMLAVSGYDGGLELFCRNPLCSNSLREICISLVRLAGQNGRTGVLGRAHALLFSIQPRIGEPYHAKQLLWKSRFRGTQTYELFWVIAAGLVATTAMLFVLDVIHLSGVAKPEPIHTIGGLITGDTENSFWTGLSLHYATGIVFSIIYFALLKMLPVHSVFSFSATGLMVGLMHGLVVGFLASISVAEHHRDARMRATGMGVVFS